MKCVGGENSVYYPAANPNFYLFNTDYLCHAYLPLLFRHIHILRWPSVHETVAVIPCHGGALSHLGKIIENKKLHVCVTYYRPLVVPVYLHYP